MHRGIFASASFTAFPVKTGCERKCQFPYQKPVRIFHATFRETESVLCVRELRFEGVSCVSSSSSQQILAQHFRQKIYKVSHIRNIRSVTKAFLLDAGEHLLGSILARRRRTILSVFCSPQAKILWMFVSLSRILIFRFLFTLRCLKIPSANAIETHQYGRAFRSCDSHFESTFECQN